MISTSKISQDDGEPVRYSPIARRRRERILKQQNLGFSYVIEGLNLLFLFDVLLVNVMMTIVNLGFLSCPFLFCYQLFLSTFFLN